MRFLLLTGSLFLLILTGCSSIPDTPNRQKKKQARRHTPAPVVKAEDTELKCLAEAVHGEARGEPMHGKIFVGRVVMTRVERGYGPNICSVVYAKSQFAPRPNFNTLSLEAAKVAKMKGGNGITHFHSYSRRKTRKASFSRSSQCKYKTRIGGHWGYSCNENRKPASVSAP